MQQPPPGQPWPPQMQPQQGFGQPPTGYGQPPSPYPPQQGQFRTPYTPFPPPQQGFAPQQPYPPQQGQWQQSPPNMQWQQPYGQPPPQQPKKKSKLPLIIGVIVVLVLFACVGASALALHGNNQNASTTTNSSSLNRTVTSDTAATTIPKSQHYKKTDAVQVGNIWNIELVSTKTSTGSSINTLQKHGDVFLVFVIKVKNISSQEQSISSILSFTLHDVNGQKYNETRDLDAGATLDGKVEPGSLLQGSIAYEVPASMKAFRLAFEASLLDPGQVIWNIKV